jgi:DNA-binding transcriptional regulator YbjK
MTYTQEINVLIASTLEKVQELNPERYAAWYSQLYPPAGDSKNWNVKTLHTLEQILIDYAK